MNDWLKKYGWYILISVISAILGGIICINIYNKNLGSLADWASVIGSFGAIIFAYRQINLQQKGLDEQQAQLDEQQKEYEQDKRETVKKEELSYRPFFSLDYCYFFDNDKSYLVFSAEYDEFPNEKIFKTDKNTKICKGKNDRCIVRDDKTIFLVENVSKNAAVNIYFRVYYSDGTKENIYNSVIKSNSGDYFVNSKMIESPNGGSRKDRLDEMKKIELYFDSLRGEHYRQIWDIDSNNINLSKFRIEQVPETKIPKENTECTKTKFDENI